jgi:hypothetical protein
VLHARILLQADAGPAGPAWADQASADAGEVSQPSVSRVRKHDVAEGREAARKRRAPTGVYQRKREGAPEARLIARACSPPPSGPARWRLRLLATTLVALAIGDGVSYPTVRRTRKTRT